MKKYSLLFILPAFLLMAGCASSTEETSTSNTNTVTTNSTEELNEEPVNEEVAMNEETEDSLAEYENTEYGFTLSYPNEEFSVEEDMDPETDGKFAVVKLLSEERQEQLEETDGYETATGDIIISVYNSTADLPGNEDNLNLREWLDQQGEGQGLTEVEETTFADEPAFTALSGSSDAADPEVYVEHDDKVYVIHNEHASDTAPQNDKNEAVIDTFKFTN